MKKEVASKLRIGGLPGLKTDTATAHTSSAGRGRVLSFTRRDGNVDFPQKITIKKKKDNQGSSHAVGPGICLGFPALSTRVLVA